jgi:hypothetical protein
MSVPRRTPHAWRWRFARGPAPERDVPGGFEGFYRQAGESVPDRARLPACTEPDVEPLSGTAARYGIRIVGPPPGGMSVRDIATHLSNLYGTDRPRHDQPGHRRRLEDVAAWRTTPLEAVYLIVYGGSNLARRVRRVGRHSLAPGGGDPNAALERGGTNKPSACPTGSCRSSEAPVRSCFTGSAQGPPRVHERGNPRRRPANDLRVSRSFCRDFSTACAHRDPPFTRRRTTHNREVGGSNPPGAIKFRSGMQFLLTPGSDPPRSTLS